MIQVFTDKESTVSFRMNIDGNKSLPEARLLIQLPTVTLSIPGRITDGIISATVPPLKHLLKEVSSASVQARLEVIADNMLFTPWSNAVELRESISVTSDATVLVEAQSPQVSIKVESAEPPKPATPPKVTPPKDLTMKEAEGYLEAVDELATIVRTSSHEEIATKVKAKLRESITKLNQADDDKDYAKYQYFKGKNLAIMEALKELQ